MNNLRILWTMGWLVTAACTNDAATANAELATTVGTGGSNEELLSHRRGRNGAGAPGTVTNSAGSAGAGTSAAGAGTAQGGGGMSTATGAGAGGASSEAATAGRSAAGGSTAGAGTAGASAIAASGAGGKSGAAGSGAGGKSGAGGSSSAGSGSAGSGAAGAPSSSGVRSAGCGLTGKPTGALALKAKDGAGVTRDYLVYVPSTYDPSKALALTIVYHGGGGVSATAKQYGLQDAPGAGAASIFAYPQGIQYKSYGVGWDDSCGGYDMAFFDNMSAYLEANYCVDLSRVYAAGFSWGCDHVTALACCRGDKIRAIGAASCADEFSNASDYKTYQSCPATNRPAIRFTHQTDSDAGYPAPYFATTLALYRSWNTCSTTSAAVSPAPCKSFAGCRAPVVDCAYDGIGHNTPPNWGTDTWNFFTSVAP